MSMTRTMSRRIVRQTEILEALAYMKDRQLAKAANVTQALAGNTLSGQRRRMKQTKKRGDVV